MKRPLTDSETDRIFSDESTLEEPLVPIFVAEDLEAMEGFRMSGEAVGWWPGDRRIVIHADVFEHDDERLRAVVAHEVGHHRGHHVLMSKVWKWTTAAVGLSIFLVGIVVSLLNLWLIPVFVGVVMSMIPVVMLSSAWYSRRLEFAADRRAAGLLGETAPLESLCDLESDGPRPSSVLGWFYELSYPWPREEDRLDALRAIERE